MGGAPPVEQGTIELKKVWVGIPGATTLAVGRTVGGSEVDTELVSGGNGTTGANQVDPGTYCVNETDPGAEFDTTLACADQGGTVTVGAYNSVAVEGGDAVVCTFTNTRALMFTDGFESGNTSVWSTRFPDSPE
jgi:hypothetical protein